MKITPLSVPRAPVTVRAEQPSGGDRVELGAPERLPDWRFALKYSNQEILDRPQVAERFLDEYLQHEATFFAMARDPESGLSFDGVNLDPATGEPISVRRFSAASKECLDLALCVKALYGDPLVSKVVSPSDPSLAPEVAAAILERKIRSYQRYEQDYPGFGGYFTWFDSGEKAAPVQGWARAFPTLDLGEMMWSLLLVEKALRDTGRGETAQAYQAYNERLRAQAREAMFDPVSERISGHVEVSDPLDAESRFIGRGAMTGEHGVHEGQMIILYMSLFAGLPEDKIQAIWDDIKMVRVEHKHGTTWQGYWGSPHEEWAYLFLPYRDIDGFKDLFRIREEIRAQNAFDRGYPGFAASAHNPAHEGYMSACGIEGVGSQGVDHNDTYTPYGAFPMLLQFAGELTGNVGLAWLHNMLVGPRLQGPLGAGESGTNDGTGAAPVKTIDVSFTNLLALAGGLEDETADLLKEMGKYDQFQQIMTGEFQETFAEAPLREPIGFHAPGPPAPPGREYLLAEQPS
ncbi:MAG: hypothetical protein AB7S38_19585 [Vulcanimicrobiota bacterium]